MSDERRLPLTGIRVLDFTWGGAGPFATKALADHGAEVIKVETNTHYDFPRTMGPYAGGIAGVNRSAYFTNRNSSKLSISVNLKKPEAVKLVKRLAATCDLVVNNFRAGILEKLGLGYQKLSAGRTDLIYVSMPLQGSSGPQANFSGVGHTLNVLSGIYGVTGYPDGQLVGPGTNYPDHSVNPGHALVAILAALIHRRRTGQGQYVEISQLESTMNLLGPSILAYSMDGENPAPLGNWSRTAAPYGLFPCANDRFIAISVTTDSHWQGLSRVAAGQSWATDPALATAEGRLDSAEPLRAAIAEWTAGLDAQTLMNALQEAGVPAGVVQNSADLVDIDPQIRTRETLITVDHPEMGPVVYNNIPFKMSRTPGEIRSAPLIGEHNEKVFGEWLGVSPDEMRRLAEEGVFE